MTMLLETVSVPLVHPMLWRVDRELSTRAVSRGFAELLEIDRDLLVGQPWFVLMPIGSRDVLELAMESPMRHVTVDVRLRRLDGSPVRVRLRRLYGGPGYRSAVFVVDAIDDRPTDG